MLVRLEKWVRWFKLYIFRVCVWSRSFNSNNFLMRCFSRVFATWLHPSPPRSILKIHYISRKKKRLKCRVGWPWKGPIGWIETRKLWPWKGLIGLMKLWKSKKKHVLITWWILIEITFQDIEIESLHLYSTMVSNILKMAVGACMCFHIPNIIWIIMQNWDARIKHEEIIGSKS